MTTFSSRMLKFFTAWTCSKTHQSWKYMSHLPKMFIIYCCPQFPPLRNYNQGKHYNQGKCVLAYNSHILCHTFKNLMSTPSLNCAESRHVGHTHICLFLQICQILHTYFVELFPDYFTDLHKMLHTASVDSTDKNVWYSKEYSSY